MTEANALIDDWMSNIVTKDDHRKLSSAKGLLAVQEEIKSGLGYSNNKQNATINSKLSTKANSTYLAVSSGKQVSKKRKSMDITEMDMDVDIVHGLVDDNLGVTSRTDISSSINKKLPISKRKLPIVLPEAESKDDLKNTGEGPPRPDVPTSSESKIAQTDDTSIGVKRKRTKTRSKQKNIRKDRREDHVKPPHLQVGSALYAGRPMTEATRIALNVPVKAKEGQKKENQKKKDRKKISTIQEAPSG